MSQPEVAVIDVETTQKAKDYTFAATPHHPDNKIVLLGYRPLNGEHAGKTHIHNDTFLREWTFDKKRAEARPGMYVGHNIKFDLLYLAHNFGTAPRHILLPTTAIWDTGVAHYLSSGQTATAPTLNDVAKTWGMPVKDEEISTMFRSGKGADDIIALGKGSQLEDYLKHDLEVTGKVFEKQVEVMSGCRLIPLMQSQMTALKAYIEMEHNGLAIDKVTLQRVEDAHTATERKALERLTAIALFKTFPHLVVGEFNPSRASHLELMLFGGEYTEEVKTPAGTFKNGNTKYTKVPHKRHFDGFGIDPTAVTIRTPAGKNWEITDKVLETIAKDAGLGTMSRGFAEEVLKWRRNHKIVHTYCKNLWANLYPDGKIHHTLNQTIARTGRLSCSNPNLQNQDEAVKEAFVSRWGDKGVLVEVDWSQLEVIGLAVRTKDYQLCKDLLEGVDIHTALYQDMYHRLPSKGERKAFKPLTFGLIYGAGATTLAENAGIPKMEAARFVETFYKRYPGVREWHATMMREAKAERVPGAKRTKLGFPAGTCTYVCPMSGRHYIFTETDGFRPGEPSFSPTELKNYPIQGLATGDWHQFATGTLAMKLWSNRLLVDQALMVLTIHDSLMFDVHVDVLKPFMEFLKETYEGMAAEWHRHFGTEWGIPPKFEAKYGPNWAVMNEWKY